MSVDFSSLSTQELHAHQNRYLTLIGNQDECGLYSAVQMRGVQNDLAVIRQILADRTTTAAARALPISAAGALVASSPSVSPCFPSPRTTSGSIERRGGSTLGASAVRLDAGSDLSSPLKTGREPALSTVEEADIFPLAAAAPDSKAVAVHAEHVTTPAVGDGSSVLGSFAGSGVLPVAPTTPLSVAPMSSAFARAISGSGTPSALPRTPAHSSLTRSISGLRLDESDGAVFIGSGHVMPDMAAPAYEMPEPPRRRSLIAEDSRSYRASPVEDLITEEELAEKNRREDARFALPAGVSYLNPPADPSGDPLFTSLLRQSQHGTSR